MNSCLRLRSLCACIALALTPVAAGAQTANDGQRAPLAGANGEPIRIGLANWHERATRLPATPAMRPAASVAVTDCGDGPEPGTLRNTIAAAVDGDLVDLGALGCSSITLANGVIPIPVEHLTVRGPGADALAIDGAALDRVFFHPYDGSLTLQGVTVRNGRNHASGFDLAAGGCIAEASYLVLENSVISGCYAGGEGAYGGAIYAFGLKMNNSILSGNTAYGIHDSAGTAAFGGAAFVYVMDMTDSTVTGNRAMHRDAGRASYDIGGGIMSIRGSHVAGSTIEGNYSWGRGGGLASFAQDALSVVNSTISGNTALTNGGGGLFIRPRAYLSLVNSTVTLNLANAGGGLFAGEAVPPMLSSTLVYGNSATLSEGADVSGPAVMTIAGSHNLIGRAASQINLPADTLRADPHLQPLASNGGTNLTHALPASSPAIDAGENLVGSAFDQRGPGYPRQFGAAPDIGAYEVQAAAAPPAVNGVPALSGWACGLLIAGLAWLMRRGTLRAERSST